MTIKQKDRLEYEQINAYKEQGRELCAYIRNPLKTLEGTCALNGIHCRAIFTEHRDCSNCLDYWLKTYGETI